MSTQLNACLGPVSVGLWVLVMGWILPVWAEESRGLDPLIERLLMESRPTPFRFPDDPDPEDPDLLHPRLSFPSFKRYEPHEQPQPKLDPIEVDLQKLPLFPDPQLAQQVNERFDQQVVELNAQINDLQAKLFDSLKDWSVEESRIQQIQREISELRAERDQLSLELLLLMRQLDRQFEVPDPTRSPGAPSPTARP